jgi:hypothetical protein
MKAGRGRLTRGLRTRLSQLGRALLANFRRAKPPAAEASATSPDDPEAGSEDLPPEPAWVEVSRSSWF